MGEGPRGSNGACSTLCWISVTPSATHNQIGPLWCWFPSGWACAHSRPLRVSPRASPVRLGVSPAATPTPTGVFNQRFEALFPELEPWVARSASLPAICPVYLCMNVGPQGLVVVRLPAPLVPHSASLGPATATRVLSAPPTGLDECSFFISLVSDLLAIRFSVRSGCARRHSVSTYAAILVLCTFFITYACFVYFSSFSSLLS